MFRLKDDSEDNEISLRIWERLNQKVKREIAFMPTIKRIYLGFNQIGDKGCKYFTRVSIPQIQKNNLGKTVVYIGRNNISSLGVSHLSKATWKALNGIYLRTNN